MTKIKSILISVIAAVAAVNMAAAPASAVQLQGVDYSGWQSKSAPCQTAAGGAEFGIVKLTQGTTFKNYSAAAQLSCLRKTGQETGGYHYAAGTSATVEATFFVRMAMQLGLVKSGILALDWESYQNEAWGSSAWIDSFVSTVHAQTGVWPVVYIQASALGQLSSFTRAHCAIWIAQYASNAATGFQSNPWKLGIAGESLRQYTSNGWVAGVGPLDLNVFRGSRSQWRKIAMSNDDSSNATPVTPTPSPKPSTTGTSTARYYTVRSGDSLSAIGSRLGVAWTAIASKNGIRSPYTIYPGQRLLVTGSASAGSSASGTSMNSMSYTVKRGDTLSGIGSRYSIAWSTIASRNGIHSPWTIYPGQRLIISGSGYASSPHGSRTVKVMSGDTASGIAARLGISWTQLSGMRSGNANLIYPGEVLRY